MNGCHLRPEMLSVATPSICPHQRARRSRFGPWSGYVGTERRFRVWRCPSRRRIRLLGHAAVVGRQAGGLMEGSAFKMVLTTGSGATYFNARVLPEKLRDALRIELNISISSRFLKVAAFHTGYTNLLCHETLLRGHFISSFQPHAVWRRVFSGQGAGGGREKMAIGCALLQLAKTGRLLLDPTNWFSFTNGERVDTKPTKPKI